MTEKCKKLTAGRLSLCDTAHSITGLGFVTLQTMRNVETGKARQQLAIMKGKKYAPLWYCPWCRSNIDTRADQDKKGGAT